MTARKRPIGSRSVGIAVNPFFVYVLFFGGAVAAYHLNWSALYPPLSAVLWVFLLGSFSISIALGLAVQAQLREALLTHRSAPLAKFWYLLLVVVYLLEFAYAGGIPIYWIVTGQEFIYEDFGLPSVHVFTMTFGCFFSLVKYDEFLNTRGKRSKKAFLWAVMPVLFDLAIVSRGFILINIVAWFFIYFLNRKPSLCRMGLLISTIAAILFAFAFLGDLRTASRNDQEIIENVILEIGDASETFRESAVPSAAFWPYIYATSPLANLQNTINLADGRTGADNFVEFAIAELLPDFVSKRIMKASGREHVRPILITPALTVATVYAASFAYLGWTGIGIMYASLSLLIYLYIFLLPFNKFIIPSLAMISTFVAFCIFDNMIYFSGISLQLAWPLLLSVGMRSAARRLAKPARIGHAVPT